MNQKDDFLKYIFRLGLHKNITRNGHCMEEAAGFFR